MPSSRDDSTADQSLDSHLKAAEPAGCQGEPAAQPTKVSGLDEDIHMGKNLTVLFVTTMKHVLQYWSFKKCNSASKLGFSVHFSSVGSLPLPLLLLQLMSFGRFF